MVPGLIARAMTLIVIGAGIGLVANAVRTDGVALTGYAPPSTCAAGANHPAVEVLPPAEAVRLCGDPGVLVADARSPERFAEGHVAAAVHLPCAAKEVEASTVVRRLQGKHTLIVYGDTTDEARPVAADLRQRIGRPDLHVVVLDGGFPAWSRAGLACSSGACPDCKELTR
jgi:3-mercaptopyruvate sulfurtransferase SseA